MKAPLENPVFLVGCPRSGTTLLQQMLNTHPAVAIAPETHFIRRFWLQRRNYGDLTIDSNYHGLIDDIVRMPESSEMELNADDYRTAAMSEPREYSTLFRLLLEQFAHRRGAAVVGEKTPNHLLYMPTLETFFPAARFIHLLRDPRAVVSSWRGVPWSTGTPTRDAMVWRRYIGTARRRPPSDPSKLMCLYYEDLVREPQGALQSVCQFLGVEYDSAMLAFHEVGSETLNVDREPWKTRAAQPLDPSRLDRWRQELPDPVVARIDTVVRREMSTLPYQPATSVVRSLLLTPVVWGREFLRRVAMNVRRIRP